MAVSTHTPAYMDYYNTHNYAEVMNECINENVCRLSPFSTTSYGSHHYSF